MGLDMYLTRRTYVKNWDHPSPDRRHHITVMRGGQIREDIKPDRISYIVEEVGYWRKANAIHKWFVDHCQGGVDECQETPVEVDKLQELVDLCKKVLSSVELVDGQIHTSTTYVPGGKIIENVEPGQVVAQPHIAEKLLPTSSGFFFGGTNYDQYYIEDLKQTIDMIEPLLSDDEGEYYYRSSW